MHRLLLGDVLSFARHYKGEPFHALLCDAPYHLTSITERFGKEGSVEAQYGKDGAFQRASKGFMGKSWDGGDISFRPETWEALGNLLYPGAFGMTFGGSRTAHRMAVAIEDAGFIIHPMIGWVYGSGFPKATRIDTQIDKRGGASISWFATFLREYREKHGIKQKDLAKHFPSKTGGLTGCVANWELGYNMPTVKQFNKLCEILDLPFEDIGEAERKVVGKQTKARKTDSGIPLPTTGNTEYQTWDITEANTPLAQSWEGHRYGLQALKPALEPIIVFQKPYEGRPVDSITKTGAGALNIDASRIGTKENLGRNLSHQQGWKQTSPEGTGSVDENWKKGRWASNFVLTHSPDCQLIGYRNDSYQINRFTDGAKPFGDGAGEEWTSEYMKSNTPVFDCVGGCPVKELDRQSGNVGGGKQRFIKRQRNKGWANASPGEGVMALDNYGDSGGASRFFHQSHYVPFYYQAKAGVSEREVGLRGHVPCGYEKCRGIDSLTHIDEKGEIRECRRCIHPTIKPIELIRHLATLLLPPEEYKPRRLLVPFAGTGSEMIGAFQAGWECVIGVELEKEYVNIGRARLQYWLEQGVQLDLFSA